MIEDDGVALRALAWAQYKKHINRWFFWETTYYNNNQGNTGQTDRVSNPRRPSGPSFVIGSRSWG